jgi:hypothetical protein
MSTIAEYARKRAVTGSIYSKKLVFEISHDSPCMVPKG